MFSPSFWPWSICMFFNSPRLKVKILTNIFQVNKASKHENLILFRKICLSHKFLDIFALKNLTSPRASEIFTFIIMEYIVTIIIYGIYWKYWFHTKNFEKLFLLKSYFLPIKSHKTWKKAITKFPSITRRRRWQKFVPHLQPRP
jgi:hypothetical protein